MSDFSENVKRQADIVKIVEGYIRLRAVGACFFREGLLVLLAFLIHSRDNEPQQLIVTLKKAGAMCPFQF